MKTNLLSLLEYGVEAGGTLYCSQCGGDHKWVAKRKRRAEEPGGKL